MFLRHQLRQQSPPHRPIERAHHAQQHNHAINRLHGLIITQGGNQKQQRADREAHQAGDHQFQTVQSIRDMPRNQKQQNSRKKLRQSHIPKVQGPVRDGINLPTHRHRLHFQRRDNEKSGHLIKRERRITKCRPPLRIPLQPRRRQSKPPPRLCPKRISAAKRSSIAESKNKTRRPSARPARQ